MISDRNNANTRIIVGMSGGVDSSVAALLLKEQGFRVEGVYMQNWQTETDDPYCTTTQDLQDAKKVCEILKMPLQTIDFASEYWQKVFQYFLDDYAAGRTPNPDVLCNKEIKFCAFLHYARANSADFIATGHYARKEYQDDNWHLLKALDQDKDQSYFLYTLNQEQLKYSLFPIGDLKKTEVRDIAKRAGFSNHAKKDSTGICFIGERKFKAFLSEYLLAKPGDIKTTDEIVIGKHDGLMFYTLGQRQGLGIGGKKNSGAAPWYVVKKDIERNILFVAQERDHPWLLSQVLRCKNLHWVASEASAMNQFNCHAKIRYRQSDQICTVEKKDKDLYLVEFAEAQRAINPGQSVVFYRDEECLGGGTII